MTQRLSRIGGRLLLFLLIDSYAFGQDAVRDSQPSETERVVVTGSGIPTADEVGPDAIQTIDRDFIDQSGERSAEDLIRNLTVAGANGVPSSNGTRGPTPGASSISLRGFDPGDTLTLIDGRRVASYPLGANGTDSFVDLRSIPRAAIESIDILKDSGSTIYGADALAGVVNIKLRHDYRGAETDVEYGNTTEKDSSEFATSLLFGLGNSSTNITGVVNYYHRDSIFNRDRDYSAVSSRPSSNTSPGNFELSRAPVIAAGGDPSTTLGDTFFGRPPLPNSGNSPAAAYNYAARRVADFNFNAFSDTLPESERYGAFLKADHEIFGPSMILYGDIFYQKVDTRDVLAPSATGPFEQIGNTPIAIPPHAPGATLGGPSYAETGVPVGAFNPFNPFQQIISGGSSARLIEFGDRILNGETEAFFTTVGLKGDKLFGGNWGYDSGFRYSQIQNTSSGTLVSASRFDRIVNAADPIFDPTSSQYLGTTVPYNPFGDYRQPIATNALPVAFATVHPTEVDLSKLATLDLNVYTTSLFHLPAGGFGFAFGVQFRWENLAQNPDQLLLAGDIIGGTAAIPTNASRATGAFYTEADLPIFSPNFHMPGFHALDLTGAVRFEDTSSDSELVQKYGLRWQPIDESLTLRMTWGEGFEEPSLYESFSSPVSFTSDVQDPVTGQEVPEAPTVLHSNRNLHTERSHTFTGGVVYTPKFLNGLTVSIDLFDTETDGRVNSPNAQDVVDRALIGKSLPGESVNRDAAGNITSIDLLYENGGSQKARGADFTIQYQLKTPIGNFTCLTLATYLDSFRFVELPGEKELELRSGVFPGNFSDDSYLKWKGNCRLGWEWRGWDLATSVFYRDGFHEVLFESGREHYVKQTWFFDLQCSHAFEVSKEASSWQRVLAGTKITIGCNNVFNHDPPAAQTNTNYPDALYDSVGRFVYVSLTKKF